MTLSEVVLFGIDVISRVTAALLEANQGDISPEEALRRISEAARQDRAVDAKVDAAVEAKFNTP